MTAPATRTASLREVLDAVAAASSGTTVDELARTTQLDPDLVRVALRQLVALGHLGSQGLELSCADGGCGACPAATAACGTAPGSRTVALTVLAR